VLLAGATATDPEIALPVEKPVPEQEVALAELQLRVEDCPAVMVLGLAVREAVGAPVTVMVALREAEPPSPVQVTE
jgi:hypothetical protein